MLNEQQLQFHDELSLAQNMLQLDNSYEYFCHLFTNFLNKIR